MPRWRLRTGVAGRSGQAADREGHPAGCGRVFRRGDELVNRFQFVADHQDAFEVKRLCGVVEVSRSSFYAWLAAADTRAARADQDAALMDRIQALQDPKRGGDTAYSSPRSTSDLNDGVPAEQRVKHKRVARVMRRHGAGRDPAPPPDQDHDH